MAYSNVSRNPNLCRFSLKTVAAKLHNRPPSGPQAFLAISKLLGTTYPNYYFWVRGKFYAF